MASYLHKSADEGNLDDVRGALDAGADVNAPNGLGYSALHLAAGKGHLSVVEELLRRGADPTALDRSQQSPLDWAVFDGHAEVSKALLEGDKSLRMDVRVFADELPKDLVYKLSYVRK